MNRSEIRNPITIQKEHTTHNHSFQEAFDALQKRYCIKRASWRIFGSLHDGKVYFGYNNPDYGFTYDDIVSDDWNICTKTYWDALKEQKSKTNP